MYAAVYPYTVMYIHWTGFELACAIYCINFVFAAAIVRPALASVCKYGVMITSRILR